MRRLSYSVLLALTPILAQHARGPEVTIGLTIYDLAPVGAETMFETKSIATSVFAAAEIGVEWADGSPDDSENLMTDFSFATKSQCITPRVTSAIRVAVLAKAPQGLSRDAVGYSLPCSRRGLQVILYRDRMQHVSSQTATNFSSVFAYSLAHEIGHVVLCSSAHSSAGVMKGTWSRKDWRMASDRMLFFTKAEASRMADSLRENAASLNSTKGGALVATWSRLR